MATRVKRRSIRRARDDIPRTEAFKILTKAEAKGRRAVRRVVLNKR